VTIHRRPASILAAVLDTAKGLHRAGVLDQDALRALERLCLRPGEDVSQR